MDGKERITQAELKQLLNYDPETGEFTWAVQHGRGRIGAKAGNENTHGYLRIGLKGTTLKCHHLAWLYVHGEWPSGPIDHANGRKWDNRIANLRLATDQQNRFNSRKRKDSTQRHKNIRQTPSGAWEVMFRRGKATAHYSTHSTEEAAVAAARLARQQLHGAFARHA